MGERAARAGHVDEVALVDRRWLAIAAIVFVASIAACVLAYWILRVTGPHPEIWTLLRRLRRVARWVLPRWSHHWKPD